MKRCVYPFEFVTICGNINHFRERNSRDCIKNMCTCHTMHNFAPIMLSVTAVSPQNRAQNRAQVRALLGRLYGSCPKYFVSSRL